MSDLRRPLDEAEWHTWRAGGIGGSDISALIGLSRYASPTSLYYEKTGLLAPREESQRQRIGKRMEAVLAAEFHDMTGLYVSGEQTWCTHPEYSWARSTVDGFVSESQSPDLDAVLGVVEFKTVGAFGWDKVPDAVRAQVTWQMGVTGMQHCWLFPMFAGWRLDQPYELTWDADTESDWHYMLAAAEDFWTQFVLTGTPPPVDDHEATTAALTEVHHDPEGDLEADQAARDLVLQLQMAKVFTKAAESDEAKLSNELRALLGTKTDLVDGTKPGRRKGQLLPNVIASWREQQSRRVDLDSLRADEPELVGKYTNTTTTRVLRVAKQETDA